jgi:predicted RNA-binding protein associated with RNAse of E/G family
MASTDGSARARKITEVKLRLRGEPKQFEVELLLREGGLTLVRFVTQTAMKGDENRFAAGSYTYGYFWDDRNYNVYRMHLASGKLYGHRFDILRDAHLEGDRLFWTDLLLDVWLYADGRVAWKDEDELAEYLREGWMSQADGELVRRTRSELERSFDRIVAEADELLGGVPPELLATG